MEKGQKRERNVNFTREETDKLISHVECWKHIIENKKSDAVTWQDKKKAWKAIEGEFNSSAVGPFRDAKHLKLKFEALKRDTRKKASVVRSERYKTGGGTSTAPLTPVEEKVKKMILRSVEGEESVYDSDQPGKPKDKRPFDKLAEEKIHIIALQKQLLEEEQEQQNIQKQILQEELEHKRQIHELEKEQMLIKIEILKQELEKAKQK